MNFGGVTSLTLKLGKTYTGFIVSVTRADVNVVDAGTAPSTSLVMREK